jgi:hypothetical protein
MRSLLVLLGALTLGGCPPAKETPRAGSGSATEVPPVPLVTQSFVQAAFGPGFNLAGEALVEEIDSRPGPEAIFAVSRAGRYELAVARGNHQILARAPLAGKILGHADITFVGKVKAEDLLPKSELVTNPRAFLLPIETLVYHRSVCGILAFRYRRDALVFVGEFQCKCWRKEAGGEGGDPFAFMKIVRESGKGDTVKVEMKEEEGETAVHRWDTSLGAFLSPSAGKAGAKQR